MKQNLIYLIIVLVVCAFANCSSDNDIATEAPYEVDSKSTKSMAEAPETPEECKPLGPGVNNPSGGNKSFHWRCSCGFLNAFYHELCISCGKENLSPITHEDPEAPISNPYYHQNNPNVNSTQWYTNVNAQKYYIDICRTNKYQNNSNYADGVNYAWFMMVKIMKLNDANVTILKCKKFVNFYLPLVEGSYKEGYIDGANAAINSYNAFANNVIAPFQINGELILFL